MEQIENPVPEKSNNKSDANAKSNSKQKIEKKSGGNKGIAILTILLLLSIGSTIWLYFDSNKKIDDCTDNYETVSSERNELLSTLDSLEQEYLILRESNDSINLELEQKIADVQALKKKVQSVRNASRVEINRLEREVALLKEIAIGYNKKIDSLGEINNNLMNSNMQLMADIDEAQKIDVEKTKQLEDLSEKVEKASVLKAINMISIPLNKNSKPNFKAKKVEKIKTSARILENNIVEAGTKTVYVRIIRNDGVILATNTNNVFKFDGEDILYSEKREITYNNSDLEFDIFYDANDDIIEGTYKVILFCEGAEIGNTSFILK